MGDDGGVQPTEEIVGGDGNCGLDSPAVGELVPLPELTGWAATLAQMQGAQVPHMPISSATDVDELRWSGGEAVPLGFRPVRA